MAVVSDTSPLSYLILIEEIELLPTLFRSCRIPEAVDRELRHPKAPPEVRRWILQRPPWLEVKTNPVVDGESLSADLAILHAGERQAILLAESLGSPLLLVDEKAAREVARSRGLEITGVLGVLMRAAQRGLVDPEVVLKRLRSTNFRMDRRLLEALLLQARRHPGD